MTHTLYTNHAYLRLTKTTLAITVRNNLCPKYGNANVAVLGTHATHTNGKLMMDQRRLPKRMTTQGPLKSRKF